MVIVRFVVIVLSVHAKKRGNKSRQYHCRDIAPVRLQKGGGQSANARHGFGMVLILLCFCCFLDVGNASRQTSTATTGA